MIENLEQFLSSEKCLACQGCCRFDVSKSVWRPKVTEKEETSIIANLSVQDKWQSRELVEQGGHLKDKEYQGEHICFFLKGEDSQCNIYYHRPFECRMYPFVLVKRNQKHGVYVHLTCPYVQEEKGGKEYQEYVEYLRTYFLNANILKMLRNNSHLFGEYKGYEEKLDPVIEDIFGILVRN